MFGSDFKVVANYYMQIRKNKKYVPTATELRHVHDVLQMMKELTRNEEFEKVQREAEKKLERDGEVRMNMDDVIGRMIAKSEAKAEKRGIAIGEAKGIAKGEAKGIVEGTRRTLAATARKLIDRKMPLEEIAEITGLKLSEVKKLMAQ